MVAFGPSQIPFFAEIALDCVLGKKLFIVRLMPIFEDYCGVGEVKPSTFLLLMITLIFY